MTDYRLDYLGPSSDRRTNRWRITPPCGHTVEPPTTMFSWQHLTCHRCQKEYVVDYNDRTMKEI